MQCITMGTSVQAVCHEGKVVHKCLGGLTAISDKGPIGCHKPLLLWNNVNSPALMICSKQAQLISWKLQLFWVSDYVVQHLHCCYVMLLVFIWKLYGLFIISCFWTQTLLLTESLIELKHDKFSPCVLRMLLYKTHLNIF